MSQSLIIEQVTNNFTTLKSQIKTCALTHRRDPASIRLLAVSKKKSVALIRHAYQLGQHDFAENYLQEAIDKQAVLHDCAINWHFIGQIQSNKTRLIAENFAWVHSVDRLKIAERLNAQRPAGSAKLNICLQLNIDNEASKAGFDPQTLCREAPAIAALENIHLRGLMAIPAARSDFAEQREAFRKVTACFDQINALPNLRMDTLSIGMSNDMSAAIAEGSTMLRIGTALFGKRD